MSLRHDIEVATPALRRLARAMTSRDGASEQSGDDLVHETLLRTLRHESPVPGLSVRNWLYANLISLNRQKLRAQLSEGLADRSLRHGYASGGREAGRRQASPQSQCELGGALQQLPLEEREAILLVALEGVSYAHAAAILALPRQVLIARLARARANLTHLMEPHEPGQDVSPRASPAGSHLRLVR